MVKKILAPTDLSELSRAGVRHALTTARELDAEVIIYHVVTGNDIANLGRRNEERFVATDFSGFIAAYETRLANFVEENFDDILTSVKVSQKVEFGTPEKSIVETAKTEDVDLIIMATHGRGGLPRMFLGSVTEQVIRNAPCMVLAIPPALAQAGEDLYPVRSETKCYRRKNQAGSDRIASGS
jgi:nucleotide-binding universal stress UspA family protein